MGGLALAWAPSIPFLHFGSLCGVFKFCLTLNSISTWPQLLMLSPAVLLTSPQTQVGQNAGSQRVPY